MRFGPHPFQLNEAARYYLTTNEKQGNRPIPEGPVELAKLLAVTESFGYQFDSLARQFDVSQKAMAWRLIECGLVALRRP